MIQKPSLSDRDKDDASDPIRGWNSNTTVPTLNYAWNWFSYHANQRLTAFNYFLIIVGFLATGYITSLEKGLNIVQIAIGFFGILISIAFLVLDIRNEQLVNDGRDALRKLEVALGMEKGTGIHRADYDCNRWYTSWRELLIGGQSGSPKRQIITKHTSWLRFIERMALILFFAAFLYGAYNSWRYGPRGFPHDSSQNVSVEDRQP